MPKRNPAAIRSVYDLARRPKLKLVVAGAKVPVGLYTREVLKRLELLRVLRKAVSQEPDVKGIVGKLALGEADAGFVYATDVRAAGARLVAIPLPRRAQPTIRYEAAVVKGTRNRAGAFELVADLLGVDGRRELARAGFGLPSAVSSRRRSCSRRPSHSGSSCFPSWRSSSGFLPAISSPGCGARPRSTRCS